MIHMTDEMHQSIDTCLATKTPCILATASRKAEPGVGFKGSMMVFDHEHLAFWERAKRGQMAHIEENPKVVVLYRNPDTKLAWKFFGTATVHYDGPVREQVLNRVVDPELEKDPKREGYAVVVRVDRIATLAGQVLQEREGVQTGGGADGAGA